MKILFITGAGGIDYLNDCIFIGIVQSGNDVIDTRYQWYLSDGITQQQKLGLYGKGMTISGVLPKERADIDRSDIERRIQNKEFDLIVYGSVWRCLDYIDTVKANYPKERVIFCDGEDHTDIKTDLLPFGMMFKRELMSRQYDNVFPISFAIPDCKIADMNPQKTRVIARMIPMNLNARHGFSRGYLYDNEHDYYNGYKESLFGVTMKKAGWDCLRHYEIIANRCLPYFIDYDRKPENIMTNWSMDIQQQANDIFHRFQDRMIINEGIEKGLMDEYSKILDRFFDYCRNNLTTSCLARYILKHTDIHK